MLAFRDVETAAYCPRKLYYRRQRPEPDTVPDCVPERRAIAFNYETLLADAEALTAAPIEVTPTQFRTRIGCVKARLECWEALATPAEREVFLSGRECRGVAHKLLDTDPPSLSLVFTGAPPETGVWKPHSVRLMAAAKALSWERETAVQTTYAEYPTHGVVRTVPVDARRTAAYREALRVARAIEGPPARTTNRSKCDPCDYRGECGVTTRSLRSLLGV